MYTKHVFKLEMFVAVCRSGIYRLLRAVVDHSAEKKSLDFGSVT